MIVVDASAALDVLLRTPAAVSVERRLFAPGQTLHAPHLIDIEVAQVLRRYAITGQLAAKRCREALAEALDAPLLTRDRRLASAPGYHTRVELV